MDASFAVNPDFKSHNVVIVTTGQGYMQSFSRKHKVNTRRITEAKLDAVDDASVHILWTVLFIQWQGYKFHKKILYQ